MVLCVLLFTGPRARVARRKLDLSHSSFLLETIASHVNAINLYPPL